MMICSHLSKGQSGADKLCCCKSGCYSHSEIYSLSLEKYI